MSCSPPGPRSWQPFPASHRSGCYPRVLPTQEGIAACEAAGVPHRNIIAMQGPFSRALNEALMQQFEIRWLVTKDGGAAGGFAEKAQAAQSTGRTARGAPPPAGTGPDRTGDSEPLQGEDAMKITLIGMGSGCPESLTVQGYAALREADLILGARRLLSALPAGCTENRAAAYLPDEILELLHASGCENAALLYSGDTGFYSGASALVERLQAQGYRPVVLPGLSSVQMLSAALGRPWQDWKLVSAHGRACDPVAECMEGKPTFFLTGGSESPATLCAQLAAEGFGKLAAAVGENLGTPEQKVYTGTVGQLAASRFESLSVLLVEAAQVPSRRTQGLPDEAFARGKVPMTKQEVRAAVLAKLGVQPGELLWDVGAGTGSVSVELALAAPRGRVYAVECDPEACALIRQNKEKFAVRNLTLVEGTAPAALENLPAPDAVFIGGTKGNMAAVVEAALAQQPGGPHLHFSHCAGDALCCGGGPHGPRPARRRSARSLSAAPKQRADSTCSWPITPFSSSPGPTKRRNAYDPVPAGRAELRQRQDHPRLRPAGSFEKQGVRPLCVQVRAGLHRPHVPPGGAGGGEPQS